MGRIYTVTRRSISPTVNEDILSFVGVANNGLFIKRIRMSGEDAASLVVATSIQRSTGGSTPGGAITAEATHQSDAAAGASTIYTTWATQPTLSGTEHYAESWNSFGGGFDLTLDGREIYLLDTEQLSIRNEVGAPKLSITVEFEEL